MIEYPQILPSSKAPRQPCIAFDKLDGSNIRVKYTQKKGFNLFGSRYQLIDQSHPHLGGVVSIFNEQFNEPLTKLIKKEYPNEREVIVFGEYFGPRSFAGYHEPGDPMEFVLFDIMVGHKNRKFLNPKDFVKITTKYGIKIPRVIYEGNLNDQLIADVREGKYDVVEGVICKGTIKTGAACGSIWMSKIKTQAYLDRLFNRFGEEGLEKYGE